MNERIKQLADQMFSIEEFEYAEEFLNDAFMSKFAELIVKECAKRTKELGQPEVGQGLLKHFRVE